MSSSKELQSIFIGALRICVCIFSIGCGKESRIDEPSSFNSELELSPIEVETSTVKYDQLLHYIQTQGKVEAASDAKLSFAISGEIRKINVENGSYVNQGQIISKLESAQIEIELKKAQVNLKEAQLEYESGLLGISGNLENDQRKKLENNLRFISGLAQAEVNYEEAILKLKSTELVAPIDGMVSDLSAVGKFNVNKGDVLCSIFDPHSLVVAVDVLQTDIHLISVGQHVQIIPLSNKVIENCSIKGINPRISSSGTIKVIIEVPDAFDSQLLPGMNVLSRILIPNDSSLVVPKTAVLTKQGREMVFIVQDNMSKWTYITTGQDNGVDVQVLDGLEEGQRVITTNNIQLAHNSPIVVINNR